MPDDLRVYPRTGSKFNREGWQSLVYCAGLENQRVGNGSVGSNPTPSANLNGDVAQLVEQFLHTEKVTGSNPVVTTNL